LACASYNDNLSRSFTFGYGLPFTQTGFKVVGTWRLIPPLQFAIDDLYADEDHAARDGGDAIWKGLAGSAKYAFTPHFSLAFRGEVFADPSGARTGIPQTLRDFTLTPEHVTAVNFSRLKSELKHFDGKFVIRGELRQDFSDVNSFRRQLHQQPIHLNLIYLF
jgi:hypothetical protein